MSELSPDTLPPKVAYDEHLYEEFKEFASFEAFQFLAGEKQYRQEEKDKFLSGEITNPILDYPELDMARLDEIEFNLLSQKEHLLANEQNEIVRQVYRWRLNYSLADLRLLKAATRGDMRRFGRYSEFVYGKPSPEIFAYTVNTIRDEAHQAVASENEELRDCVAKLLKFLPEMLQTETFELPNEATVELAHHQTVAELSDLIELPLDQQELNATQIKAAFDTSLDSLQAEDWQTVIDEKSSKSGVSISQSKRQVQVPEAKTETNEEVAGLILHEVGTHVARRINGERSRLKLLGLGLDRYTRGEEGIASMREQALKNEADEFRGMDGHLAIGLAQGLDGQPRDFRQVYEIMLQVKLMQILKDGKETSAAIQKAQDSAWNRCIRTFRGTDCKTPGVCFTQDIVYREGNIGVWEVIKNNPEEMMRFNVGKYDPANPRHLWILEQLGITDEDLSELEK